ncbi:MAG TPA: hypothetical protein VEY93_03395 [Longimicrobium sp.]|nr:hypothetical protein [Longimicrobium sp.]
MLLLTTNGRWENTTLSLNGRPLDGARLYLRYTVERDRLDRIRAATLTGFLVTMQEYDRDGDALDAPLMGREGGMGLFPGTVEIEIGGRMLVITNESPKFGADAASGLATRVTLRAFDSDLELPAFSADQPRDRAEEMVPFLVRALNQEDITPHVQEVLLDFDYPRDRAVCYVSLIETHLIKRDRVVTLDLIRDIRKRLLAQERTAQERTASEKEDLS